MKKLSSCLICIIICIIFILPASAATTRDVSVEHSIALDLRELGLFNGISANNFDLERTPTRTEVIVMLIRVLGKEAEALNGDWEHPFIDVPEWANKYVGYAYQNGLTQGISKTKFGVGNASAGTYLTFVLRALGYSDQNNLDFSWDDPYILAQNIGILPDIVNIDVFWRADIATISYAALGVNLKGSTMTLADKLIEAEVFTAEAYHEYFNPQKLLQPTKNSDNFRAGSELKELNANEIHTKCSSAVFYIEIYNANNQAVSSGSGFFITQSGIAVTNYHVIEDASYAKIYTTYDTVHDVLGVYDYDEAGDWAVLQIDGSDFSHLKINSSSVSVGDSIFALGSPRGLDDTISTGIISNPSRILDGQEYIQISAPISHGSSGGALLNSYGEVIGITSAGYDDAQNLNFARPISCIENANLDKYTTLKDNITKASQSVEYSIDNDIVTVEKGQEISLFLNYTVHNRTTESITFTVETTDPSIADVRWGKTDSQPWEIIISGESAGDTLLIISNDATTDFKMVSIRVTPPTTNYGYITYSPYKSNVEVYAGQESSLFIDLFEKNIPSSFDLYYYVSVNDSDIANVRWDKNVQNLPWNVIITGLSPGVTYIEFSNNYNNQIYTVPLTVLPSIDPDIHSLKSALIADGEYNESSDTYEIAVDYIDDSIYSSLRLVYFYEHDKLYLGSLILLDDDVLITYIPVDTTLEVEANILLDDAHAYCKIQPKYYTEKTKLKLSSSKGDKNAISFISNTLTDIIMFTLSGCEDMILSEYGISLYDLGYESLN